MALVSQNLSTEGLIAAYPSLTTHEVRLCVGINRCVDSARELSSPLCAWRYSFIRNLQLDTNGEPSPEDGPSVPQAVHVQKAGSTGARSERYDSNCVAEGLSTLWLGKGTRPFAWLVKALARFVESNRASPSTIEWAR